jgi:predicted DNA-binding transcriptional regulator YafY
MRALTETILLDLDASPAISSTGIMIPISSAAKLQRRVHIHYRSHHDEETQRDLDPYGLAHFQGRWYVVGHCSLRNDLRSFRLDRILEVKLTETHFKRPPDFDALTYLMQKMATLPRQFPFEILLKTDLIRAQNETLDLFGVLEPGEDGLLFRGSTDDLDWLARELAKLPFNFVVHQPGQLRIALRNRAMELAKLAEAS